MCVICYICTRSVDIHIHGLIGSGHSVGLLLTEKGAIDFAHSKSVVLCNSYIVFRNPFSQPQTDPRMEHKVSTRFVDNSDARELRITSIDFQTNAFQNQSSK